MPPSLVGGLQSSRTFQFSLVLFSERTSSLRTRPGMIDDGGVSTRPIVEYLDVFEDVLLGFVSCGIVPIVHEFLLELPEEVFDVESFFSLLKNELVHHRQFQHHADARYAIAEYI